MRDDPGGGPGGDPRGDSRRAREERGQQAPLVVRPEAPADVAAITAVVSAAFGSEAEARLVELIRSSPGYVAELSLVAEVDGTVVGHVMISHARLDGAAGDRRVAMLSPLAVAPEWQGRGVGAALVRAAVDRADELGEPLVVLEGGPAYYGRLGFEPAARHGIELPLPSWAPPEAAQVLRLGGHDPTMTGRVVYPPAFDHVTGD